MQRSFENGNSHSNPQLREEMFLNFGKEIVTPNKISHWDENKSIYKKIMNGRLLVAQLEQQENPISAMWVE